MQITVIEGQSSVAENHPGKADGNANPIVTNKVDEHEFQAKR